MYRQLNAALRSEDRKQLVAYFPYLKLFLTALWKGCVRVRGEGEGEGG